MEINITDEAVHTPVIGPNTVHIKKTTTSEEENPRAGIKNLVRVKSTLTVQDETKSYRHEKTGNDPQEPGHDHVHCEGEH